MKRSIRRILVAVKELPGRSSPTIAKAAHLAHALGAQLELFHVISQPLPVDAHLAIAAGIDKFEDSERARYVKQLEAIAGPLRRGGLKVSVAAEWDYPAHQAVIRRARKTRADLIVAGRHAGRHLAPWLLHYNDWELLRHSPVPVLLVKTRRPYERIRVLAGVDPSHALGKTAGLDDAILRTAAAVSTAAKGQLHAVHAFVPSLQDIPPRELTAPDATARIIGHAELHAQTRFMKAMRAARLGKLPRNRYHLLARHPADAISALVKSERFDLVVMGLARSGLKGLFIGNTAAQLLDALPCDLLIVKPPGFASSVPARIRGPHLISIGPPPYAAV